MPGSCGSDANSSPSLISRLRTYRFQNKTRRYKPGTSGVSDTPKQSSSNKPKANGTQKSSENLGSAVAATSSASSSAQSYNPLSYRKYEISENSLFLIQCLNSKIKLVFRNSSANSTVLELKLTPEEFTKLKEICSQHLPLSEKWAANVSENSDALSNTEKVLKLRRPYLYELLKYISGKTKHSSLSSLGISVADSKTPVKTYSRVKKSSTNSNQILTSEDNSCQFQDADANFNLKRLQESNPKGAMDEYEVFCEKEQNLRKLLDAFPGADIMEAQDILVKCNWDLKKAIEVSRAKPPRTTRKRSFSQASPFQSAEYQKVSGNAQASSGASQRSTDVTEEIVLDSSDDENTVIPPKVSTKKTRRMMSSSESDSDGRSSDSKSNLSSGQTDNAPKSSTVPQSSAATSNTVSNTSDIHKKTTLTISQSLTIKPVSNSTTKINEQPEKTVSVSNAIPNLPKGLVITQIGAGSSSANKTENENKLPESSINGTKSVDNVSGLKQRAEAANIPSLKSVANSNSNKSAHLVRIKSLNSSVTIKPSESTVNIKATGSVSVSEMANISANKSVSITPVISKTISITPVGSEKTTAANHDTSETASLEQNPSKPKNIKGKRKRYDSEEEDDEDYGNEDIYDSEDSECEENLTSAHSAVLKFFQESSAEELGTIPGCSKKKVEVIINCRPFSGWSDLVEKLKNDKSLSTDMLNGAKKVLDMRNAINKLMTKCQRIALDMEDLVENLKENKESCSDYVSKQPDLLNDRMHLTSYQMLGLNWLLLMHNQEVNGILADEMGLGKTVQAIAFLAYLKEISISGPHLIVVPSSTLDNWKKELHVWWPSVSVICYHGNQESRREMRMQILNDEVDEFDVMITTYNMVTSSAEDRSFFKRLEFHYVVFDEAHMLKNMASQRYQHLMRVKAPRRLLLTGTPLQNNLVELMSLLIFAMPHMFSGKTEQIKQMFSAVSKTNENKNSYEKDRIDHAKRIMKPFVLRRLKREVLKELPTKHDETKFCPMVEDQAKLYEELVAKFSEEVKDSEEKDVSYSGFGMMMQLRRAANHPLLLRHVYDDDKLLELSKLMLKEPTHCESDPNLVFEDMSVMSDFELHKLCKMYESLKSHGLPNEVILNSGKFRVLEAMIPKLLEEDHRILLFSQFTMVLDIIQEFMTIKGYKFLRLDGQVPVPERQQLIDDFNNNPDIVVFLLSTRAGGLGINLTAADTVILHDVDFNPYNDKQAEDRCHRVGQLRDVRVIRFVSEHTIEEGILQRAKEKLKLERDIHEENETEENDIASVAKLLREALGLKNAKS